MYFNMKIVVNYLNFVFHIEVKTKSNHKFLNFVFQFIKNTKWHFGYTEYYVILFNFLTNLNKSMLHPVKVKLYHKADWNSINFSLSKHLTTLQEQILNLISSDNVDSINIINNADTILTGTILNIYKNLPEKIIKPNSSIPFSIQLLIKQRAFIKTRNPFFKSAMKKVKNKLKILGPLT